MKRLIDDQYEDLRIDQDLGLGMMLWLAHFFPHEEWAKVQHRRALMALDHLWTDPPGFFARASYAPDMRIAFANYGVSLGLQATGVWPDRVDALTAYFERYRSGDAYDREAITHVMARTSHPPGPFLPRSGLSPARPTQPPPRPARLLRPRQLRPRHADRLRQLRSLLGAPGHRGLARPGGRPQRLFRTLPLRRRLRPGSHYPRHGLHQPPPWRLPGQEWLKLGANLPAPPLSHIMGGYHRGEGA